MTSAEKAARARGRQFRKLFAKVQEEFPSKSKTELVDIFPVHFSSVYDWLRGEVNPSEASLIKCQGAAYKLISMKVQPGDFLQEVCLGRIPTRMSQQVNTPPRPHSITRLEEPPKTHFLRDYLLGVVTGAAVTGVVTAVAQVV